MTMRHKDFAAFILTHGRPDNVRTYASLRDCGYTGDIYLIVDNEDDSIAEYQARYGNQVIIFDKAAAALTFDACDNFNISRKTITYARNASYDIARSLGLNTFVELDDDYFKFEHRFTPDYRFKYHVAHDLDAVFDAVLDFYLSTPIKTLAFAQGGDFIGGRDNPRIKESLTLQRKAMNAFFCCVDRQITFIARMNEDVCTYCTLGSRGELLMTAVNCNLVQEETQAQAGGSNELYQLGTYIKAFYTVMNCPSFVDVSTMGEQHRRIHHRIKWKNAVPVIISEQYRKPATSMASN